MHELGIANSILDTVRAEVRARSLARPVKVAIKVGALAGVDGGSLSFCFEALVKGTDLDPLALEIEPADGDELQFSYLEVEDS